MDYIEKLLKKAEDGDAEASLACGWHCVLGNNGFEQNDEQAKKWFEKAIEQGNNDGYRLIGFLCERNFNISEAIEYYKKGGVAGDVKSASIVLMFLKTKRFELILENKLDNDCYKQLSSLIADYESILEKSFENSRH